MNDLIFRINSATFNQIKQHLELCSLQFIPPLNSYVNIEEYSLKIFKKSTRFEVYHKDKLVGLIATYINQEEGYGFITNVSLELPFQGLGISQKLLDRCVKYGLEIKLKKLILEVNHINSKAIKFYSKNNFKIHKKKSENVLIMELKLHRDYNKEFKDNERKYAYNFDFDVMHPYMIESFKPFFIKGSCLELGSFKGDFTKRLVPYFEDLTCVEASEKAIEVAKQSLGDGIVYFNSLFENVELPKKYDNIILTHVLEHIDNPINLLSDIRTKWLSKNGRLFVVCPNANAPSRQIAVKMGLVTHNSAITSAEAEHGHRITYTLDTLERDVRAGGLDIIYRSGIFFKALANFQWDKLLQTDIINKDYLDGCYQLGQQYPDLCSSIMLVCKNNE